MPISQTDTTLDFVTYAADNYSHWVAYWLESASRSNPDSRLFVYDISAQPSPNLQRLVGQYHNAQLIPWPQSAWKSPSWIEKTNFQFFWQNFSLRDEIKYLSRRLRYRLTCQRKHDWMIDKRAFVADKQLFIHMSCQKPHILHDAWRRSDRPLAFVDADAVVLAHIPSYPGGESDIAVTVEEPDRVRIGQDGDGPDGPIPIILINAGVIFINRTSVAPHFLDTWVNEMERVHHGSGDQTALANLLYRHDHDFHKTLRPISVGTDEGTALVACLPCARYNQVRIPRDSKAIRAEAAIAHFVGSWKQKEHWDCVEAIIRESWLQRNFPGKIQASLTAPGIESTRTPL